MFEKVWKAISSARGSLTRVNPGRLTAGELFELLGRLDPVVLEIGCNNGSQTRWLLDIFEDCVIHAFEPDPRAGTSFKQRIDDDRVTLHQLAIADCDGSVTFHLSDGHPPDRTLDDYPSGWNLSGSIRKPKEHLTKHPWCSFDRAIEVPTRSLDSWFKESGLERIDFIWADVQGAEVDLINGGSQALAQTRYFYTEYSNRELYEGQIGLRRMLSMLPDFEVVHRYRNDVLLRNRGPGGT